MTEYEAYIRRDERMRVWGLFAIGLIQRMIGALIILLTITLVKSGLMYDAYYNVNDSSFALFTIPVGLFLLCWKNIYKFYVS